MSAFFRVGFLFRQQVFFRVGFLFRQQVFFQCQFTVSVLEGVGFDGRGRRYMFCIEEGCHPVGSFKIILQWNLVSIHQC